MKISFLKILTIAVFGLIGLGIIVMVIFPFQNNTNSSQSEQQARVVIPRVPDFSTLQTDSITEHFILEEDLTSKIPLADGEIIVSVLTDFFDGGPVEKQFVAFRNLVEVESPIYLTFIDYEMATRRYTRVWNGRTAASRLGTIQIQTMDLLGDRSHCVLVFGMNARDENTLTIFRKNPVPNREIFSRIFELSVDGSIDVRETQRAYAYQIGHNTGESFNISALIWDNESSNILDQIEVIYSFNANTGVFEEINRTRIPGSQVEQRRVRELLGNPLLFEQFITGLWHFTSPQGDSERNQYVYFDPPNREIIFYGDGIQQIFTWRNSTATRYGLHIISQNISIANLRRSIDIELESLDSIRIRVREDIRLRFNIGNPWDGSYIQVGQIEQSPPPPPVISHINASFDSRIGRIHFFPYGTFEIGSRNDLSQGIYTFFRINGEELLEFRLNGASEQQGREVFLVENGDQGMVLNQIRLGARGITRLHEGPITLTPVD